MASLLHLVLALSVMAPCGVMAWRSGATTRRRLWCAAAVVAPLCTLWVDPLGMGLALVDGRLGVGLCGATS